MKTNNTTINATTNTTVRKNLYNILNKNEVEAIESLNQNALKFAQTTSAKRLAEGIINDGLKTMTLTGRTWFVAEIPTSLVIVDVYQRMLNDGKVNKLYKTFDWDYVTVKTVNYRPEEGVFALIDGHHTSEILKLKDEKTICCRVFVDYTYQQEAKLFSNQDFNQVKVNITDKFFADLEAQDEIAIGIMDILRKYGLKYDKVGGRKTVTSIRKMKTTVRKYGFEALDFTFKILFDAGWGEDDAKAFNENGLTVGFCAYEKVYEIDRELYGKTYSEIVRKMRTFKTSTAFVDYAKFETGAISTCHPDKAIKDVMPCVIKDTQRQIRRKAEKYIKIMK